MSEPKIMKYFQYSHLPLHLQKVSEPFCVLAEICVRDYPNDDPEDVIDQDNFKATRLK